MLRIASACRSVSSNSAIITGLGSSSVRMISITRSRLRKAIRKPSTSSSRSSILPIRCSERLTSTSNWKSTQAQQRLLEAHHARRPRLVEHVEVEREAHLQVGQPVEALLEQRGIDRAAARLQHDPHLVVALVAHVGQDRQLLVGDQLGDLLDQLALLHAIGDLVDQQVPAAALLDHLLDPRAQRGKLPRPLT